MASNTGQEIAVRLNTRELREIQDFDQAIKLMSSVYGTPMANASELGDGFEPYPFSKETLVGRPMMILDYRFGVSTDYKNEDGSPAGYVVVKFLYRKPNETTGKAMLTDGSAGIFRQLSDFTADLESDGKPFAGLAVPLGLRVSKYQATDSRGDTISAETYYLSTSSGE